MMYYKIKDDLSLSDRSYDQLYIRCYVCDRKNHLATECPQYKTIAGNIRKHFWSKHPGRKSHTHQSILQPYYKFNMRVPKPSLQINRESSTNADISKTF